MLCRVSQGKKRGIVKMEDDLIPLPDPFPLPKHYQRNVEDALRSGNMPTKERRMFLSDVAFVTSAILAEMTISVSLEQLSKCIPF